MGMTANQLKLIEAVARKDTTKMHDYAIVCCAEDTTQKNRFAVKRCMDLLKSTPNMIELPAHLKGCVIEEDLSEYKEARYFLSSREKILLDRIQKMSTASVQLQERGVKFLNATLLYGQSGVGKTEFAKYLAHKMDLPFMYLNFSNIIDSYMGSTSRNMSRAFDFLADNRCVLMLDELDAVGSSRVNDASAAGAESNRIVITLIQQMDRVSNEHIIFAATNRPESIDPAVKRRFTVHHEMLPLDQDESVVMIENQLKDTQFAYDTKNIMDYVYSEDCGKTQAEILSHVTMCMADALIENREIKL